MGAVRRIGRQVEVSAGTFLGQAEALLQQACTVEQVDEAIVAAYRAALRAAGAIIATSMLKRKRTPPGSAWMKLRTVAPQFSQWADIFEGYARLSSRADMGLERNAAPERLAELYHDACAFVSLAQGFVAGEQQAA